MESVLGVAHCGQVRASFIFTLDVNSHYPPVTRLIRVERRLMWKPFHVPCPSEDDLLPTTNIVWDSQTQSSIRTVQRHPASVSPSVRLGAFQRNCQCAILLTRAVSWEMDTHWSGRPPSVASFEELDITTRALIEAMLQQTPTWGEYFECFATCTWYVSSGIYSLWSTHFPNAYISF